MNSRKNMSFIFICILSLSVGNFAIYVVDKLDYFYIQKSMSAGDYVIVNAVIILVGVFTYLFLNKKDKKQIYIYGRKK